MTVSLIAVLYFVSIRGRPHLVCSQRGRVAAVPPRQRGIRCRRARLAAGRETHARLQSVGPEESWPTNSIRSRERIVCCVRNKWWLSRLGLEVGCSSADFRADPDEIIFGVLDQSPAAVPAGAGLEVGLTQDNFQLSKVHSQFGCRTQEPTLCQLLGGQA